VTVTRLAPHTAAKHQILADLSDSLSALSSRMRAQQAAAVKITALTVKADRIALASWELNKMQGAMAHKAVQALVKDVNDFAREVAEAANRAGTEVLLGKEVADAITAHANDIATLARDFDTLPDAAAVRARLRPLAVTLNTLPERLKASNAMMADITGIGVRANALAVDGEALAAGGRNAPQAAAKLSRELRIFADEATAISLNMASEAAGAVKAIDTMTRSTLNLSLGKPVSSVPDTATDRLLRLAQVGPRKAQVW